MNFGGGRGEEDDGDEAVDMCIAERNVSPHFESHLSR